jgi:hypothetical protein
MSRIGLDIDSTLHHYWDLLESIAERRFGVSLPYESQHDWGIIELQPDQLRACVEETHSEHNILGAEPYAGAVEAVRGWHAAGHFVHVTSHRAPHTEEATARWLRSIGLPYDDLRCSYDKVSRCVELGIDVLVDDSPVNLAAARERGMLGATIVHPWNRRLVAHDPGVVGAGDWIELRRRVEPLLAPGAEPLRAPSEHGRT